MTGRWFKMGENIFLDRRLQKLPASLFRMWANLLAVASWSGGALPDLQDVAFLLRLSPGALTRRLDALKEAGLVSIGDDGQIIVHGAVETVEHGQERPAPMSAAERQRLWRERRRGNQAANLHLDRRVTEGVTGETPLEEEKRERDEDSPRVTRGERDDAFNRFWSAYPARGDGNPRQPAEVAFRRAVAAGADPEALIQGARRYAAAVAGREGRYICSAVRWITERRFEGAKPVTTATPATAPAGVWISADSDAGRAWASFYRETKGRTPPVDAKGGWRFPAPLPPVAMAEVAA